MTRRITAMPEKCAKVRHPNIKAARYAARRLTNLDGSVLSVYKCSKCGGYHIGHTRDPIKLKEAKRNQ